MDEVNLLDDGLVDVVLDSSASGVNTVEREGVSIVHPAKFIMIGSGNPQVGDGKYSSELMLLGDEAHADYFRARVHCSGLSTTPSSCMRIKYVEAGGRYCSYARTRPGAWP